MKMLEWRLRKTALACCAYALRTREATSSHYNRFPRYMKRTPFLNRILSLLGTVIAVTMSHQDAYAGTMHTDATIMTYMDFAQNRGRYEVGTGVNALLNHIRTNVDNGITIHYTDGTPSYTISNSQGMISFMGAHDGGYAAAISPNYIATVSHNGEIDASFAERAVGSAHAINYSAVGVRSSATANTNDVVFRLVPVDANGNQYDYMVTRQSKIFTDITWNPLTSITDIPSLQGELQYHVGGGSMNIWSETDGQRHLIGGYIIGSIKTITTAQLHNTTVPYTNNSIFSTPNYGDGIGASLQNPLPLGTEGGDSGSPVFIYNPATGQYEYLAAHQSGIGNGGGQARGNIEWTQQMLERFNVRPDMSSGEVHLQAITHAGDYYADKNGNSTLTHYGYATDAEGNILGKYTGIRNGLSTWGDLSDIKDVQNWYAYDSNAHILQSDPDLFFSSNLVFTAQQASSSIVLDATVDLGIGYAEFDAGKLGKASFTITSAEGANHLFNHSGYVINEGAEVHLRLNNPADYMYEWRKNGAGDLYIDGTGDTNALLAVGGSGTTYLQQKDGYAAYNVVASSGTTVVINDISQIERDFTFGSGGATLDINGNSMDWYTTNTAVEAAGFSINALTDEAMITNTKAGTTATLTYKEGGEQTYLGSFKDTADAALRIDYAGGGTWSLHSIHTNLSSNANSGLTVSNGKVIFSGTNTIHGMGTLTGEGQDRIVVANDWHYADASMNVDVAKGGTFELGSHARLIGNITVADGGTFIMREGVKDRYEYVEGAQQLEDTYQYQAFYGLHGNIALSGNMLVEYSEGTTANTTLTGNISGAGSLTVKAGTTGGTLTLAGNNSQFSGSKEIVSGGVIATSNAALGDVSDQRWLVGKQGWIASHEFTESTDILSFIDTRSTGTLALSNDIAKELNLAGHTGLFIGAEVGKTVSYGTADATLSAIDGKYKLGGGGGELVVNFKLTGDDTALVLGADASSTGTVTLTNTNNDFGGGISFTSTGIILNAGAGTLGNSSVALSYGNALVLSSTSEISHVTTNSNGILMLNNLTDAEEISTREHKELALGASTSLTYSGNITLADGEAYRFSVVNGATMTLKSQLSDSHDLLVDAQGYQGGTLKLAGNDKYTGDITVQGNRNGEGVGNITLAAGRNMELTGNITLAQGGTLDVSGYNVTLSGNIASTGGSIINSSWTGSPLDTVWRGELTYKVAAGETLNAGASMVVPSIRKTGEGELVLSAANTYTDFYLDGGKLTLGHESASSIYGTVHMAGGTTLDLRTNNLLKNTFLTTQSITMDAHAGTATVLQTGATADHVASIGGDIVLGAGSRLNLKGAGAFSVAGTNLGGNGALLYVDAPQLTLNSNKGVYITGTLQFAGDAKLYSNGTAAGMTRNISHLALADNSNFVLEENSGTSYWAIDSLTGSGTFQWNSGTNQFENGSGTASRVILKGANDYTGHIILNRTTEYSSHTHGAYIELAHNRAAQNADITLTGMSTNGWASLAVNTDNATIKGLNGNAYGYVLAAPAGNTIITGTDHPASNRKSTLTIHTDAGTSYTFAGVLGHWADSLEKGLNLVKSGAGEQNFTGTVRVGDVTVNAGTLNFTGSSTTVLGNVALSTGSTLSGLDYILSEDKMFSVNYGTSGSPASFSGQLTLAGGQFNIDALALGSNSAALNLGGVNLAEGTTQTITLTNSGHLTTGTYTIATGNWTSLLDSLSHNGISGYDVSLGTNDSGHLQLIVDHKSGAVIWDGTADKHVWNSNTFGSGTNSLGQNSIATFTNAATGRTVSVAENVSVGEATFLHSSGNYTVESAGGTATVSNLNHSGAGTTTIHSGMEVTGTTAINSGEIIVTSGVKLGTVTGEGTLGISWDANTSHSYKFDNLNTLNIRKGTYGSASDGTLNVRNIVVQEGGTYVQGRGATYAGNTIAEGGTIALNNGSQLGGSVTVNQDSFLSIAAGSSAYFYADYTSNDGAQLIQIGGGTIIISAPAGKTYTSRLDNYVVREGTLSLAGWGSHNNLGTFIVENGGTLEVGGGAGLQTGLINLKSGGILKLANGDGPDLWWRLNYTNANILVEDGAIISGATNDVGAYMQGTIYGTGTLNLYNAPSVTDAKTYKVESTIYDGADGALGLNIANTTVTFTGASTYSGGTVIDSQSAVTTANATALGRGEVQNAGSLKMNSNLSIGGISGNGSLDIGSHVLALNNDTDKVYTGTVTGKGGILQTGTGSSTFTSSMDLAAVGVQAGHLILAGDSTGISTEAFVAAGAELSLGGHISLGTIIENEGTVHLADNTTFTLQLQNFTDNAFTLIGGTGSISYGDAFTSTDITVDGYTLSDLASNGVTYNLVQSGSSLSLSLDNINRPLVWTGEEGADWNRTNGNWSYKGENGASFNLLDAVVFDDTAKVKNVNVSDAPNASSMTVSGTGYTFNGALNVSGEFLVESGASATLTSAPSRMGQATVKGDLTLRFGGTLTQDIDASEGTIHVAQSLTWNPTSGTIVAKNLDIQGGTFQTSSAMEVDSLKLGSGVYAILVNNATEDASKKRINQVRLGNAADLIVWNNATNTSKIDIGEVVMESTTGYIQDLNGGRNAYIGIDKLSMAEGLGSSTLTFYATPMSTTATTVFELGAPGTEGGNFAGYISMQGSRSNAAIVISGEKVAEKAVIKLTAPLDKSFKQVVGINADNVTIAGLASDSGMADAYTLFSGTTATSQGFSKDNITNAATRNLIIDTAAGASHTFYGEVLSGVNLTKTGNGTQAFAGKLGSAAVTVQKGTLNLSSATLTDGALAEVNLHRGGTLQLGSLNLAAGNKLSVLGTELGSTATLNGDLVLDGGELNFVGTTLDTTSAALTVGGSISLTGNQTINLTDYLGLTAGNSYFLIAGNFASGITADNFTLSSLQDGYNGSLSIGNGGLWLTLAGAADASIWAGNTVSYTWNADTFGSVSSSMLGNKTAVFDDTAANRNVVVDGNVTADGGVVFNNSAEYTLSGTSTSSSLNTTDVTLNGEGTVNVQMALNTDKLTVNNGKLKLSDFAVLGQNTAVKLTGDGVMNISSTTQTLTNLSMTSGTRIEDTRGTGTLNLVAAEGSPMALNGEINVGTISTQGEVSLNVGSAMHTLVLGDTNLTINNAFELNSGRTISVQGDATLNAPISMAGGTLMFDNAVLSGTEAALDLGTAPTKGNGGVNIAVSDLAALRDGGTFVLSSGNWSAFSGSDFSLTGTIYASNLASFEVQNNSLVMNLTAHGVWAGTEEKNTWSNSSFGADPALANDKAMAIFDNTAKNKTVSLSESVTVGDILFNNERDSFGNDRAYTVAPTQAGLSITGEDFVKMGTGSLEMGADLKLSGNMELNAGDVHFAGTTQVDGSVKQIKGAVTFGGENTTLGDYRLESSSTLNITGANTTIGNMNLVRTGGDTININFASGSASVGSINLGQNALLSFQKPEGGSSAEYNVNGEISFSLNVWGGASTAIQVDEGVKVKVDSIRNSWGMGSINIDGEMEVTGGLVLSSGSDDPITGSGKLTTSRLTLSNTGIYAISVAEVRVTDEMVVNGSRQSILRSDVVTSEKSFKQTGGVLTLEKGVLNLNGTSAFTGGTLQLQGGEINVQSGTVNIANTVEATTGKLTISGGDLQLNTTTAHNLLEGIDALTMTSGSLNLADISFGTDGSGAIALREGATFAFNGGYIELGQLGVGTYNIFDFSAEGASVENWLNMANNILVNGAGISRFADASLSISDNAAMLIINDMTLSDIHWAGGAEGNWDFTTANWSMNPDAGDADKLTYLRGDKVIFSNDAKLTATADNLAPASIQLKEGVDLELTAQNFTLNTISLADDATLNLKGGVYTFTGDIGDANGAGTVNFYGTHIKPTASTTAIRGNLNILSDATYTANRSGNDYNTGVTTIYGNLNIGEDASLTLNGNGRVIVEAGAAISLADGAVMSNTGGGAYWFKGALNVEAGATAVFHTVNDVHFNYQNNGTASASINLAADSKLTLEAQSIQQWGNNNASINLAERSELNVINALSLGNTKLNMAEGAKLSVGANSSLGAVTTTGSATLAASASGVTLTAASLNIAGGSTLTVDTVNLKVTSGINLTDGSGLSVNSSLTLTGTARSVVEAGTSISLADRAVIKNLDGGAFWYKGALNVEAGASAEFFTVDDIHFNYQNNGTESASINLAADSKLTLKAKSIQQWGNNNASINLAERSELNVTNALSLGNTKLNMAEGAKLSVGANSAVNAVTMTNAATFAASASGVTLTAASLNLTGGNTLAVDTVNLKVTDGVTLSEGARVLGSVGNGRTTTIIPANGGVLDDRNSFYAVGGTLNIGEDNATSGGTVYVKGLALMGSSLNSTLNVKDGSTFVITGTDNTGTPDGKLANKNYGDFQITTYDDNNRNQKTFINVDGTLTANTRFSVAGGTGTINVKDGGTVNMLAGTAEGGAGTSVIFNVDKGGRVNVATYENGRSSDGDNNVSLMLADGATVGGIARSDRGEDIYMLQKVEVGGTATIDTDAATYDTTSFVVTETDNGTDMVFTRDITSKSGVTDAVLRVTGHGTAHVAGQAKLTGGVQVDADAALAISNASLANASSSSTVKALATLSSADGKSAARMNGSVHLSHPDSSSVSIAGTGTDRTVISNGIIELAQGTSLSLSEVVIADTSRIAGTAANTLQVSNATIQLGAGNSVLQSEGTPATLTISSLQALDGSGSTLSLDESISTISVTSSALSDLNLTLSAGSTLTIDFTSILTQPSIMEAGYVVLDFDNVALAPTSDSIVTGVYKGNSLTAYYVPQELNGANVGSLFFSLESVPEPATSTLSLLALAALAARRRRK